MGRPGCDITGSTLEAQAQAMIGPSAMCGTARLGGWVACPCYGTAGLSATWLAGGTPISRHGRLGLKDHAQAVTGEVGPGWVAVDGHDQIGLATGRSLLLRPQSAGPAPHQPGSRLL